MCGRYYVDDDTAREIEKVIRQVDEKLQRESRAGVSTNVPGFSVGDIHPTELAPVLVTEHGSVGCRMLRWGLPGYVPKGSGRIPLYFSWQAAITVMKTETVLSS